MSESWRDAYSRKFISAEQAADLVKPGDTVVFTMGREAHAVGLALSARKEDVKNIQVFVPTPGYDFGWYDEGWQDSFNVKIFMPTAVSQEAMDNNRCDIVPVIPLSIYRADGLVVPADIVLTEVSPPDEKGFCSFGQSLWNKKKQIRAGRIVIAEVNQNLIRTYGDNYIHISEIDYFVEHVTSGSEPAKGTLAGRSLKEPEPYLRDITVYVSEIIKYGDTIQIGVGRTTEPLVRLGLFNGKHDIGVHSEATPAGIITLVKEGVINGKYKTINQGKVVVTSLGGGSKEEMAWSNNNPLFELVDLDYLEDIRTISAHDNMVSINNALNIDLSGQITAESLGSRLMSATGGQFAFVVGALVSKGGRAITVLPSTAKGGSISRIVPQLPLKTVVTLPRSCADYIVTEYGIAKLWGKSVKQRAEELIAIAHPKFRNELKEQVQNI